ncbi:MAG: hypothetical protein SFW62_00725 [Alphaproteobacteria bacterium]|nr:hypothetical protein [Alphaproteobacteria bacterium]
MLSEANGLPETKSELLTPEQRADTCILNIVLPIALAGAVSHNYPDSVPAFLRWHLINLVDVPMAVPAIKSILEKTTGPVSTAFIAAATFACGVGFEIYQAFLPKRSFDYVDVACYGVGAVVYLAARTQLIKHFRNQQQISTAQP